MYINVSVRGRGTMKIIIAHPEKQHSYRLAHAINKSNSLAKYITTVYYKANNITAFFDRITKHRYNLSIKRRIPDLNDNKVVQVNEIRGLLLLGIRHTRYKKIVSTLQNFFFDSFGRKVAKIARKECPAAVVMYDTNSLECFKALEGSGILRIMDTSIANRHYTKCIYQNVINSEEEWNRFSESHVLLNKKEMDRLLDEIHLTDHFLVPSNFVKDSLLYSGVQESKIHIVPYGVDIDEFYFSPRLPKKDKASIELIFVGECSYRKGINLLLSAVVKYEGQIHLTIIGNYQKSIELYQHYNNYDNISFLGRKDHEEISQYLNQADVFALPSLSEGMSLAGLEALASGLPLLCTKNCGVNDLIIDGYNGWIIEAGSEDAITFALNNIINCKRLLPEMSINARKTAEKYSWANYEKRMIDTINMIVGV